MDRSEMTELLFNTNPLWYITILGLTHKILIKLNDAAFLNSLLKFQNKIANKYKNAKVHHHKTFISN